MISPLLLHYIVIAGLVFLPALGVGIGQGFLGRSIFEACDRQPAEQDEIQKTMFILFGVLEMGIIFGLVMAVSILFNWQVCNYYDACAELGIFAALAFPAFMTGITAAFPAREGLIAMVRQPFFAKKIMNFMILILVVMQTPVVFGFLVGFIIRTKIILGVPSAAAAAQLVASGISIGIGSLGPSIGMAFLARNSCCAIGTNKQSYDKVFTLTLFGQAFMEASIIFSLLVSFMLLVSYPFVLVDHPWSFVLPLAVSLAIAIGTVGPGISLGRVSAAACKQVAEHPSLYNALFRMNFMALGIIEASVLYAFIISMRLYINIT